jgi:APA family basic amino acid/polyamine antiporter
MLAYLLASLALIALRIKEPRTPRAYRVPLNFKWRGADIPIFGILAVLGTFGMLAIVLWTHAVARILGPLWIAAWIAYYIFYRYKTKKPMLGSVKHDWDADQLAILADTGESELYEQFKIEVERKKRNGGSGPKQLEL